MPHRFTPLFNVHPAKSGRNMALQLEEHIRDTLALERKGVCHVLRAQQLVVEAARRRIGAEGT
jgi:hypothetical protein